LRTRSVLVKAQEETRSYISYAGQIIIRAREQHLLAAYRESHPELSEALKNDTKQAWDAYFQSKLLKCLAEADKPKEGEDSITAFQRLLKRDAEDEVWRKEARSKEEKFGLVLGSLVSYCI
jgi:cysteinyl-tRNA synthetase